MPVRSSNRLTRDSIIEAALEISRQTTNSAGVAPTGQSLGKELNVDRSAIWRHFTDKDDLLLSVADAMLEEVAVSLRDAELPDAILEATWRGVLDAFLQHPSVGAQLGDRSISGPHALVIVERLLQAFSALGLAPDHAILHYRSFIDLTLSCASTQAQYALLSNEERRSDDIRIEMAIRSLNAHEYPFVTSNVEKISHVGPAAVLGTIFASYLSGIKNSATNLA